MIFGHFSLKPSNHLTYNNSEIGDLFVGDDSSATGFDGGFAFPPRLVLMCEVDVGSEDTSSSCSVTTKPRAVSSLLRVMRL